VAQCGSRPAGQHGRKRSSPEAELKVADPIDAAVDQAEPATGESQVEGTPADPGLDQLAPRNDSMLSFRQLADDPVGLTRDAFATDSVVYASLVGHEAESDGGERTACAPNAAEVQKEAPARRCRLWL
jgi:hypothetical protein